MLNCIQDVVKIHYEKIRFLGEILLGVQHCCPLIRAGHGS